MSSQVPSSSRATTSGWTSLRTSCLFSRTARTPTTTTVVILHWSRSSSSFQKRTASRMIPRMRYPFTLLPPRTRDITWLVVGPSRMDFRLRTQVPRRQRRRPSISHQRAPHTMGPAAGAQGIPGNPGSSRNTWFHPLHRTLTWSGGSRLPSRHPRSGLRCPSRDPATYRSSDGRPATAATWGAWAPGAPAHRAPGAPAAPTRTPPCHRRRRNPTEGGSPDSVSIGHGLTPWYEPEKPCRLLRKPLCFHDNNLYLM